VNSISAEQEWRGYINEPEMTKQKFIPNPFHPGPSSYMYRTGDW